MRQNPKNSPEVYALYETPVQISLILADKMWLVQRLPNPVSGTTDVVALFEDCGDARRFVNVRNKRSRKGHQ